MRSTRSRSTPTRPCAPPYAAARWCRSRAATASMRGCTRKWGNRGNAVYTFTGGAVRRSRCRGLARLGVRRAAACSRASAPPRSCSSRRRRPRSASPRNTIIGHGVGIAAIAFFWLAMFGLHRRAERARGRRHARACGARSLCRWRCTGGVLRLLRAAHPPAGRDDGDRERRAADRAASELLAARGRRRAAHAHRAGCSTGRSACRRPPGPRPLRAGRRPCRGARRGACRRTRAAPPRSRRPRSSRPASAARSRPARRPPRGTRSSGRSGRRR